MTRGLRLLEVAWLIPTVPAVCRAESLLELFRPDPLADLDASETLPRTRRGQVIYPDSGIPALLRPGGEVRARVRVRRAMTPPPGVQQPFFLLDWQAKLFAQPPLAALDTTGQIEIPLEVVQIRPEDEGFVYRIRLRVPGFLPAGVYDLEVVGPGLRDLNPRAVRVLPTEPEDLEIYVVSSGQALWQEASAGPRLVVRPRVEAESAGRERWAKISSGGLAGLVVLLVLLGWRRGNIFPRRRRSGYE